MVIQLSSNSVSSFQIRFRIQLSKEVIHSGTLLFRQVSDCSYLFRSIICSIFFLYDPNKIVGRSSKAVAFSLSRDCLVLKWTQLLELRKSPLLEEFCLINSVASGNHEKLHIPIKLEKPATSKHSPSSFANLQASCWSLQSE